MTDRERERERDGGGGEGNILSSPRRELPVAANAMSACRYKHLETESLSSSDY